MKEAKTFFGDFCLLSLFPFFHPNKMHKKIQFWHNKAILEYLYG